MLASNVVITGSASKLKVKSSFTTSKQGVNPVIVKVRSTEPERMSSGEGMYFASTVFGIAGSQVPVPVELQMA